MSSMRMEANLDGVYGFIGGVGGIIEAMENVRFKGDFTDWVLNDLKKKFTTDAIAASGSPSLQHVFEWGPQAGGVATGAPGVIPLFRLSKSGRGGNKQLSYYFVPSTTPVPLPNPAKYGFSPDKLEYMTRHVFKYKAIVMESGTSVNISAKWSNRGLFIPTTENKYGYVMTKKTVTVNPGGSQATGGFSEFWVAWFESQAEAHANKKAQLTEQFIAKTGRTVLRNAAGLFATKKTVGVGYVSSAKRTAELKVLTDAKRFFSEGPLEDWDEE